MSACPKCGFDNPPDARFCGECGNTLTSESGLPSPEPVAPRPESTPVVPHPPQGAVDSGLKVGVIIGTLFIPLIGLVMGAIYMSDRSPEKKKVGRLWLTVGLVMCAVYFVCVCIGSNSGYGY